MTKTGAPRPGTELQRAPDKRRVIAQLKEASRLLELLGDDPFKAKAYAGAVRSLERFEGDFAKLFDEDRLTEIRGIGQSLAREVAALGASERLPLLDALYARVPEAVRELFVVSGLGPKKIAGLWAAGVGDLETLALACDDGRVAALKGFSAKTAAALGEAARFALVSRGRMRLDVAEAYAELVRLLLAEALPGVRAEVVGELRRRLETVARLELVAVAPEAALREALEPLLGALEGEAGSLRGLFHERPLELTSAEPTSFGAVLALRTGSEAFTRALRARAAARGLRLEAGGLYHGETRLDTPGEAELFAALGLPETPPERREEAQPEPVTALIEDGDLKGFVHTHSSWSDGAHSLREMVAGARARGARYLATADHSRSSQVAGGLSLERLRAQAREIAAIRRELIAEGADFTLLHGLEVDILPSGELDFPDEILAELDCTVVSVHSHFGLSEEEQTARIVRAVQSPQAHILAHPTGRLLLRRPGYAVNIAAVIDACAATGTVIEINASPYRLDLDWRWLGCARARGCRFAINSDAHAVEGLDALRFGVMMARKAGLGAGDVVNTALSAAAFLAQLKKAA